MTPPSSSSRHKCKFCGLVDNWSRPNGCSLKSFPIETVNRPRIPYTPPYYGEDYEHCHDCGATEGRYHHPGCDMETCINCGGQLISCPCELTNKIFKDVKIPEDVLRQVFERARTEEEMQKK